MKITSGAESQRKYCFGISKDFKIPSLIGLSKTALNVRKTI